MLRRIFGGVALAAVITTGAHAQFMTSFTLNNVQGFNEYNNQQVINSINLGSWDGFTANASGANGFQVFCVDQTHDAFPPTTYTTWASSLSGNLSDTRHAAGVDQFNYDGNGVKTTLIGHVSAQVAYTEAAYLATQMQAVSVPTQHDQSNFSTTVAIQYAIWEVMGDPLTTASGDDPGYASIASNVAAYVTAAKANEAAFFAANGNNWVIFTDVNGSASGSQEFLGAVSFSQGLPTPEPGTMAMLATGLVGLAGAGFRRRK